MATESDSLLGTGPKKLSGQALYALILSLYAGVFIAALDGTLVTGLLSHIASDLQELKRISWIGTSYLLAYAAFQPIYGKLSDIYGRKAILIFCNLNFGLGCFICWKSSGLNSLVLGRFISGVGGGGMLSLSTITISDFVPLRSRGMYQGFGNIAFGLGAGFGGVFGGIISKAYGWRAAFGIQVPLVAISILLTYIYAPGIESVRHDMVAEADPSSIDEALHGHPENEHMIRRDSLSRIDFLGSFFLIVALFFLMFAIATGGVQFAWISYYVIGSLIISAVSVIMFCYVELHVAKEPVLPLPLFTHRTILGSSLTNLFMTMSVYMILFYIPVHLSSVFGYDPETVGYRLVANFFGVALGSFASGYYMRQTGKYWYLGLLSPILYFIGVFFELSLKPFQESAWSVSSQFLCMILCGLGYASMLTVTLLALIAAVPHEFQATTTSIQYTFRGVGSTLGVAIGSSIFSNVLAINLEEKIGDHPKIVERVLNSVEAIRKVPEKYQHDIILSYSNACKVVFLSAVALGLISVACSALMKEHELHSNIDREEPESQPSVE